MRPLIAFVIGNLYALCGVAFIGVVNSDAHRHRWHRLSAPIRAALAVLWPAGALLFFSGDNNGRS